MVYVISFAVLFTPLLGLILVSSRLALRTKTILFALFVVAMVSLPIAILWVFGGILG